MGDVLFCRTKVYDAEQGGGLTQPKPDVTLGFKKEHIADSRGRKDNKCFDEEVLDRLLKNQNLLSSPFHQNHNACFPWAIYEGKAARSNTVPLAESQAVNAAVKCLKMLESLTMLAGSRRGCTPPIPCFTCKSSRWELWICYRSGENESRPTYVIISFLIAFASLMDSNFDRSSIKFPKVLWMICGHV